MNTKSKFPRTAVINPKSDVRAKSVGENTVIAAYCVIGHGVIIGENCRIEPHVVVSDGTVIGNGVTVSTGAKIARGVNINSGVFIGQNCIVDSASNNPESDMGAETAQTVIRQNTTIEAGAIVLPYVNIGANVVVKAGAVVGRNVPTNAIVGGSPAEIQGYTVSTADVLRTKAKQQVVTSNVKGRIGTGVRGVWIQNFHKVWDMRGALVASEFSKDLPFHPQRFFLVFDVPTREIRGEHAHHLCDQLLICVAGSCSVVADDGESRTEVLLNQPHIGIYLPRMTWGIQYKYSKDAVLLVLASEPYEAADYIRDYDEFLRLSGSG